MKIKIAVMAFIVLLLTNLPSSAFIKLDDKSIDIAINYSIKMNNYPLEQILDKNWMNDGTGRILTIYSPFIQLVMKTNTQRLSDNPDEDLKNIKKFLNSYIQKTKQRNEIRFLVSIYGDKADFSSKYTAYIALDDSTCKKNLIKPKKISLQKEAQKDYFNPEHPFSAVNCYTFKFDDLFNLKDYYFIIVSDTGEAVKYKITNKDTY